MTTHVSPSPAAARRRIRAATFQLMPTKTFVGLTILAVLLVGAAVAAFLMHQQMVGMTVALPAACALIAAVVAFRASRTSVSVDTDGIRFRQNGRVRTIVSWSDYVGWRRDEKTLFLLRDQEEPVPIPTLGVRVAWNDLTAALDEIRPNAA